MKAVLLLIYKNKRDFLKVLKVPALPPCYVPTAAQSKPQAGRLHLNFRRWSLLQVKKFFIKKVK
jgi:hypothetical protein